MHRFSIIKSLEIFSLCSLKYSFRLSLMLSSSNFRKHRNPCWKTLRKRNAQISYPINSTSFSEHYKKYFGLHLRVTSNTFKKVVYLCRFFIVYFTQMFQKNDLLEMLYKSLILQQIKLVAIYTNENKLDWRELFSRIHFKNDKISSLFFNAFGTVIVLVQVLQNITSL